MTDDAAVPSNSEQPLYPLFNPDAACVKCGSDEIGTGFHRGHFYAAGCDSRCPGYVHGLGEHHKRTCRRCHFTWAELPIDAGKIVVERRGGELIWQMA